MKENPRMRAVELNNNDQPIEGTERILWDSRSMAVAIIPIAKTSDGQYEFLVEKRGPGCPDNIGKYVMPCGYLNRGESLREAGAREMYEETGLKINPKNLKFAGINDDPAENRENVTVRFVALLDEKDITEKLQSGEINTDTASRGGEGNECDDITLIPFNSIDDYEFAFNHDKLMKKTVENLDAIVSGSYYWDSLC